jgi:hypothetical protein
VSQYCAGGRTTSDVFVNNTHGNPTYISYSVISVFYYCFSFYYGRYMSVIRKLYVDFFNLLLSIFFNILSLLSHLPWDDTIYVAKTYLFIHSFIYLFIYLFIIYYYSFIHYLFIIYLLFICFILHIFIYSFIYHT